MGLTPRIPAISLALRNLGPPDSRYCLDTTVFVASFYVVPLNRISLSELNGDLT